MPQTKSESDQEILNRLRKPIDELAARHNLEGGEFQRFRLRQLAWQAVDVLARTGNVANLKNEKEIKRIIRDIKQIGAPKRFINESLLLAVSIYREMEARYPALLQRYRSGR